MSDINVVALTGRLTRDPDFRQTNGGFAVLGLGLAVGERRKNSATGQYEDYTNFIDCTVLGKRAESLSGILRKGMPVSVNGRLRWSQWEKDGQRRSKVEVLVDELVLPPRGNGTAQNQAPTASYGQSGQTVYDAGFQASVNNAFGNAGYVEYADEDIPF